jgi:2-methylisocitrate lyase-like PEP mutase family enzyme
MPQDLAAKAADFRALHDAGGCFVMPNAWDIPEEVTCESNRR